MMSSRPRVKLIGKKSAVGISVAAFFALKLVLGVVILVAAARALSVADFAIFSQLLVLLAFLVTLATGGVQHGVIRQVAVAGQSSIAAVQAVVRAGLFIWAGIGALLIVAATMLASRLSVLLIGSPSAGFAIPWLAVLAVGTGLGTLLCAILTGQGRPIASLVAQAVGLTAATALALLFLVRHQPVAAAMGFAAGPVLTTLCAIAFVGRTARDALRSGRDLAASVRQLLGFSGAFLATAALMPLTLLALRSMYREAFGLELLGYWLAANRISDVNTQLLGLYLTQEYLPKASRAADEADRHKLAVGAFVMASVAMLAALAVFSLAPAVWITLFLSAKFVPAAGFMQGYFLGDVLRVASSLAAYTALAHKRLFLYVSIEALAAAGIAAFVIVLTTLRLPYGPAVAYAATYGILAAAILVYSWRTGVIGKQESYR